LNFLSHSAGRQFREYEGCGSVNVVKEFKKTVQECLNTTGVNPDDSASHLLSLKKIFGRIGSI
jgi:hypothetical protein